jgi:hypothetical protein
MRHAPSARRALGNDAPSSRASGIGGATYIITAQRGNVQGMPSRQLTVTFGSGGPGLQAQSRTSVSTKLAA